MPREIKKWVQWINNVLYHEEDNLDYGSVKTLGDLRQEIKSELLYTQTELNKAVQDEREACALECKSIGNLSPVIRPATKLCAEAIRARTK